MDVTPESYNALLDRVRQCFGAGEYAAAVEGAKRAVALDPSRPEGYNALGALQEVQGDRSRAQAFYRIALVLAPDYRPALDNLDRTASCWARERRIALGGVSAG